MIGWTDPLERVRIVANSHGTEVFWPCSLHILAPTFGAKGEHEA